MFKEKYSKEDRNNKSNQLNPNNDAFWQARGYDSRPDNWKSLIYDEVVDYSEDDLYSFEWQLENGWL